MAFNKTLQQVANFLSTQADLLPMTGVGGYTNEPFLTYANYALSDLITEDNDWKVNRAEMPTVFTCPQKQDYLFAGASAFSLGSTAQGWAIDLASNSAITVAAGVVTVTFLENHRFAVGDTIYLYNVTMTTGTNASYNSVFTDNGSSSSWSQGYVITTIGTKTVTFAAATGQNNSDAGGAPGINDFFCLSSATKVSVQDNSSPQYVEGLNTFREQPAASRAGNPENVAVMSDSQTGVLKIRFYKVPSTTLWGANLVYQRQAPTKVSLGDNWGPFPDHYSAVYTQSVVYQMHRGMNWATAGAEYIKLQEAIKKAQGADDAEETSVSLQPENLMDNPDNDQWGW